MTCYPLWYEERCTLQKEQTCQKRMKLRALQSCYDRPIPLFQKELELEEVLPQTYHPGWELRDRLFLICLFLELTQANL